MSDRQDRIAFGEPYEGITLPEEAMPVHSRPGKEGREVPLESPFQVFFVEDVLTTMWKHARSSPQLECAGGLFGHPFFQPETMEPPGEPITFVIITLAVPYETPEQAQGHVRVTADALEKADTYVDREYSGLRPVGWYHTHPGHGIFLSGYDKTITHSIFNAAWHVAVVIDPLHNQIGLFRGPEGEQLPGYRLLRELPLEMILMQRYNRGCALMDAGHPRDAYRRLQKVSILFQRNHSSLPFWRGKPAYRDLNLRIRQLGETLQDLKRLALPAFVDCSKEALRTTKREEPRPIKERIADRTLEALNGVVHCPLRVSRRAHSVVSRLLGREG